MFFNPEKHRIKKHAFRQGRRNKFRTMVSRRIIKFSFIDNLLSIRISTEIFFYNLTPYSLIALGFSYEPSFVRPVYYSIDIAQEV